MDSHLDAKAEAVWEAACLKELCQQVPAKPRFGKLEGFPYYYYYYYYYYY